MPIDILLDENGDLAEENGDFKFGESTHQHQRCILLAQKGEYKASPGVGVGIGDYLNDDDLAELGAEIQKQFELDGMKIKKLDVYENGRVDVDAEYDQ